MDLKIPSLHIHQFQESLIHGEGVPARRAGVSLGDALKRTKDGSDGDGGR